MPAVTNITPELEAEQFVKARAAESTRTDISLTRAEDGRLFIKRDDKEVAVEVRRCFPWSSPDRFFTLRDEEGNELALIDSVDDLEPASRDALKASLLEAGFVFEVHRIIAVEEEFEIRQYRVETAQGVRRFQTARDEWPRETPAGGYLIRDVGGDIYHIPQPEEMDEDSQTMLWALVD